MKTQPIGFYLHTMLVFLLVSIMACENDKPVRIVEDARLDSLLAAAPETVVDLDALQKEVWYPDHVMGTTSSPDTSLLLARPLGIISASDSFYIADGGQSAIFVADLDGVLHRRVGREGEGPLEFEHIMQVVYNDQFVFVKEGNKRIQVLDNALKYVDVISCPSVKGSIEAMGDYLFVPCGADDNALVSVRRASPPFRSVASLLPILIEVSRSYNHYEVAASLAEGRIFAGYSGLPYLFVYDEQLRHIHTIRFEGDSVRKLARQATRLDEGGNVLVQHFFQTVSLLGDRYLAVAHLNTVYIIDIKDDRYQLVKTIKFDFADPARRKGDKGIHIRGLLLREKHLYLATPFEAFVYRFPFQLALSVPRENVAQR